MSYHVRFYPQVEKELRRLSQEAQKRVVVALEGLAENPFKQGVVKLKGEEAYRIRVGDYRIIYEVDIEARIISILRVAHRKECL